MESEILNIKKGYLCLESEGSEIHFRNLRILELPPGITTAEQTGSTIEVNFEEISKIIFWPSYQVHPIVDELIEYRELGQQTNDRRWSRQRYHLEEVPNQDMHNHKIFYYP